MADIKVDKIKYFSFLNSVRSYVEKVNYDSLPAEMQAEKNYILSFINNELEISCLMDQRKLYYDFYMANKDRDAKSSNEMYKKYLETKEQINKLREA